MSVDTRLRIVPEQIVQSFAHQLDISSLALLERSAVRAWPLGQEVAGRVHHRE